MRDSIYFGMVEYHVNVIPQFQDILDRSGERVDFGGWLSVRINLVEFPVIFLGQDEQIFKNYFSTKKTWYHKGKCRHVTK